MLRQGHRGLLPVGLVVFALALLVGAPAMAFAEGGNAAVDITETATTEAADDATTTEDGTAAEAGTTENPIEVAIATLTSADTTLEGKTVTFTGEAVGTSFDGDDAEHRWVNLADENDTVVGVYMTTEQAEQVETYGHYGVRGSTVRVVGVYHTACNDGHAGELDVHAVEVEQMDAGSVDGADNATQTQWLVAALVALGAMALFFAERLLKRRRG